MKLGVGRLAVVLLVCWGQAALGQAAPTEQSIETEIRAPFLMLRGMWDGEKLAFDSQGNLIGSAAPSPFALSFLIVNKVDVTPDQVEIEANRAGLEITRGWPVGTLDKVRAVPIDKRGRFQVVITIQREPQHDALLQNALERVFHTGFDDGLEQAAPQYWRPWIAHEIHPERPYPEVPVGVETGPGLPANKKPKPNTLTFPRLVHSEQTMSTEAARIRGLQGESTIGLIVDESGTPRDLMIVRPIGMGLDEMALLAVMKFRFTPAIKDGRPVQVWINVAQNFH